MGLCKGAIRASLHLLLMLRFLIFREQVLLNTPISLADGLREPVRLPAAKTAALRNGSVHARASVHRNARWDAKRRRIRWRAGGGVQGDAHSSAR